MYQLTWLAEVLRNAGLVVVEEEGWQTRGQGDMGKVVGVILHHTGGPLVGDTPSLGIVLHGRGPPNPLPGPLSHLFLARSGTFHVCAAGLCNHAGKGSWHGVAAGNHQFIGIEAENAGTGLDHWPIIQMLAYQKGVTALLEHLNQDELWAVGHKEYALPKGRKVDPSFDMITFRQGVASLLDHSPVPTVLPPSVDPHRDMLRKGDMGDSVKMLQHALGISDDGNFGSETDTAVRAFQQSHGLNVDGLVGPKTWALLGQQGETS